MAKNKKRKKKLKKIIIIVVIIIFAVLFVLSKMNKGKAVPESVTAQKVVRGDVEATISSTGTIKSENSITYYAVAGATVSELNVQVGDIVHKGDVLVMYDNDDIIRSISENELKQESSESDYKAALNSNYENQTDYSNSTTDVESLEAQIEEKETYIDGLTDGIDAERDKRYEEIALEEQSMDLLIISLSEEMNKAGRDLSDDDINYYNKRINECKARLEQLTTEKMLLDNFKASDNKDELLKIAKRDLEDLNEELAEAKSTQSKSDAARLSSYQVDSLTANNDLTNLQTSDANSKLTSALSGVVSDVDGIISEVSVTEGMPVLEGSPVIKVESIESVKLVFGASKYELESLKEGQLADVTIAGNEYQGEVTRIEHVATTNTAGSSVINVEVSISNPDDKMYIGMDGKVVVHVSESKDTLIIPAEAINTDRNGDFVYIVDGDEAKQVYVTTGISSTTDIEVLEGLKEGDEVITLITSGLEDGKKVVVE